MAWDRIKLPGAWRLRLLQFALLPGSNPEPSGPRPLALCSPDAGPTGKVLLMPEDPNAVFIMVATGTGIAPYRSFWRRQFLEDVPNYKCVTAWCLL